MPTSFSKMTRIKSVRIGFKSKSEDTVIQPMASVSSPMLPINPIVPKTTMEDRFFNDERCQYRALYMTTALKRVLVDPARDSFWRMVGSRLYTLNYILFVLPSHSHARAAFLNQIEAELCLQSDGQELHRRGGMEAHFAVRYALKRRRPRRKTLLEDAFEAEKRNGGNVEGAILPSTGMDETRRHDQFVEQARNVIEQCLEQESRLRDAEKETMYIENSECIELRIELEEDRALRHRLKRMVDHQRQANPFKDQDLEDSRQVDSGYYEGWHA